MQTIVPLLSGEEREGIGSVKRVLGDILRALWDIHEEEEWSVGRYKSLWRGKQTA